MTAAVRRRAPTAQDNDETKTDLRQARREQLIEAAFDAIACHGITGATMARITALAGMSVGIVNFYFRNKQTLFEETLRHLAQEHRDHWHSMMRNAALDPASRLMAMVQAQFHPDICSRRKLAVWAAFYGEVGSRAAYRQIMTEIDNERWDVSAGQCRKIIAEGGYDADPQQVAQTLEGLFDGFCLNILIYPSDFTSADACDRVLGYLAGVFPQHFPILPCAPQRSPHAP